MDASNVDSPATQSDAQAAADAENVTKRRSAKFVPGRLFWGTAIGAVAIAIVLRFAFDDTAVSWMFSGGALVLLFVMFLTWLLFFSAYAMTVRFGVAATLIGLLAFFGSQYRFVQITGGGVPIFKRRDAPALPPLAEETANNGRSADLSITGAGDFPRFLGPNLDGVVEGVRWVNDWQSQTPELVWKRPIGEGWSGFSAVNGFAVTMEQRGDEELISCYEVASGQPVWQHSVECLHTDPFSSAGPRSTPTIYNGRVYAVGATGIVRCLEGTSGKLIWQRDFLAELGISYDETLREVAWGRSGSPLIVEGKLILPVGGVDDNVVTLRAMDPANGETVWESGNYQISYATPTYAVMHGQPQILSVNQDVVTSHDLDTGKILWEHPWPGLSNMNANVSNAVPLDANRVFLSKGYTHGCELLQVEREGDDWIVDSLWQKKYLKTKLSNVSIRDGFAYGLDDGILSCVEVETGRRQWKKGRYGYGQILLVDGVILVLSEDGQLALVEANPENLTKWPACRRCRGRLGIPSASTANSC